jgi:hypothetical protein
LLLVVGFPLLLLGLIWIVDTAFRIDAARPRRPEHVWLLWGVPGAITAVWLGVGLLISRRTARAIQDEIDAIEPAADDE